MIADEYKSNTIDLQENFVAPEVNQKKSTFKSDVYSIGKIIEFMFKNEMKSNFILKYICDKCCQINPENRPTIYELIIEFYFNFFEYLLCNFFVQFEDYFRRIFKKNIILIMKKLMDQKKTSQSLYDVGIIYAESNYVTQNINIAIHYFLKQLNKKC